MQFGAVALVLVKTIFGKLRTEVTHDSVAGDFRDHARGRDRQTVAIAVDDRGLREGKRKNGKTVDQDMFRRNRERPSAIRIASCDARKMLIRSISR